jgi:hypothetical protein
VSHPTPRPLLSHRDTTVDGLRGIAAMLVVLRHVLRADVFGYRWFHAFSLGNMGVHLFFVISGFVIGALLTNQRSDLPTLARFMARRLVRLTPPYYAAIALAIVLLQLYGRAYPRGGYLDVRPDLLLCSLAYVCYPLNLPLYLNVGWSLEIEVQFYLIACLLVPLAVSLGTRMAWLIAASAHARAVRPAVTALHYAPFVIGMAIAAYRRGTSPAVFIRLTGATAGWARCSASPKPARSSRSALAIALGCRCRRRSSGSAASRAALSHYPLPIPVQRYRSSGRRWRRLAALWALLLRLHRHGVAPAPDRRGSRGARSPGEGSRRTRRALNAACVRPARSGFTPTDRGVAPTATDQRDRAAHPHSNNASHPSPRAPRRPPCRSPGTAGIPRAATRGAA